MAIVVKSKKIKEEIVDETGKVLGYISYNPEDTSTYTKLTNILDNLVQISDEMKSLKTIKKIPEDELIDIEDFEKYREDFNRMSISLNKCEEKIGKVKENIDLIFGKGTSEIIMEGSNDVDMLVPLIEEVLPKFKSARESKVNKYLSNQQIEQLDVME
ncbi:MAG: hypothetical protein HFI09_04820 [Bacilli bacterium]|nr:hypothetical protein [Bacilli bacterium]